MAINHNIQGKKPQLIYLYSETIQEEFKQNNGQIIFNHDFDGILNMHIAGDHIASGYGFSYRALMHDAAYIAYTYNLTYNSFINRYSYDENFMYESFTYICDEYIPSYGFASYNSLYNGIEGIETSRIRDIKENDISFNIAKLYDYKLDTLNKLHNFSVFLYNTNYNSIIELKNRYTNTADNLQQQITTNLYLSNTRYSYICDDYMLTYVGSTYTKLHDGLINRLEDNENNASIRTNDVYLNTTTGKYDFTNNNLDKYRLDTLRKLHDFSVFSYNTLHKADVHLNKTYQTITKDLQNQITNNLKTSDTRNTYICDEYIPSYGFASYNLLYNGLWAYIEGNENNRTLPITENKTDFSGQFLDKYKLDTLNKLHNCLTFSYDKLYNTYTTAYNLLYSYVKDTVNDTNTELKSSYNKLYTYCQYLSKTNTNELKTHTAYFEKYIKNYCTEPIDLLLSYDHINDTDNVYGDKIYGIMCTADSLNFEEYPSRIKEITLYKHNRKINTSDNRRLLIYKKYPVIQTLPLDKQYTRRIDNTEYTVKYKICDLWQLVSYSKNVIDFSKQTANRDNETGKLQKERFSESFKMVSFVDKKTINKSGSGTETALNTCMDSNSNCNLINYKDNLFITSYQIKNSTDWDNFIYNKLYQNNNMEISAFYCGQNHVKTLNVNNFSISAKTIDIYRSSSISEISRDSGVTTPNTDNTYNLPLLDIKYAEGFHRRPEIYISETMQYETRFSSKFLDRPIIYVVSDEVYQSNTGPIITNVVNTELTDDGEIIITGDTIYETELGGNQGEWIPDKGSTSEDQATARLYVNPEYDESDPSTINRDYGVQASKQTTSEGESDYINGTIDTI